MMCTSTPLLFTAHTQNNDRNNSDFGGRTLCSGTAVFFQGLPCGRKTPLVARVFYMVTTTVLFTDIWPKSGRVYLILATYFA